MKIKFLLSLLILFSSFDLFSQSTDWNDQNRYWYYRYRLVNDFLIRGEENPLNCNSATGYSLPAGNSFLPGGVDVEWGDATTYLGWYIGVLATEYKLLLINNQPTNATKQELYFAMKAYERLDRKAERLFFPYDPYSDCSVSYLNGIFVRDDVSKAFLLNHPNFVSRYNADGSFTMHSDFNKHNEPGGEGPQPNTKDDNIYATQDQISNLFMGFALVKKCLDNDTYLGYNFSQQAVNYTSAIVNRLIQNGWVGKLSNNDVHKNGYNIRDELCSYGIAKAAQWITGLDHTQNLQFIARPKWDVLADPLLGPAIMNAEYTGAALNFVTPVPIQILNGDPKDWTTALEQTFAAVGHSWEYSVVPVRSDVTGPLGLLLGYKYEYVVRLPALADFIPTPPIYVPLGFPAPGSFSMNVTGEFLSSYGLTYGQEIYALLHEYLSNDACNISSAYFSSIIQQAPCEGPQHKPSNNPSALGVNGWRSFNRWERPLSSDGSYTAEGIVHETGGRFNGLDYLLVYNLYLLTRGGNDTSYKNSLSTTSSNSFTSAGKYWNYETLTLSGPIPSNASTSANPVEISANNTITLKPGFSIASGVKAKIYIGNNTACNTTIQNNGSLSVASPSNSAENKELMKQQVFTRLAAEIQQKLDSILAAYPQSAFDSAAFVADYMEQHKSLEKFDIYPNPSTGTCYVTIKLEKDQNVKVIISDIYGNERKTLLDGYLKSGVNRLTFNINEFKAGVLYIELKCAEFGSVKRMIKRDGQ